MTPTDRVAPRTEAGRQLVEFEQIRQGSGVWAVTRIDILAIEAEARQQVVEQIRERAVLASDDFSDDDGRYGEIPLAHFMEILDSLEEAHRGD